MDVFELLPIWDQVRRSLNSSLKGFGYFTNLDLHLENTSELGLTVLEESWRKLIGWGVWNSCSSSMTRPPSPSNLTAFCNQPESERELTQRWVHLSINLVCDLCYWCKGMSARVPAPVPISMIWRCRPSSDATWSTTILENCVPVWTSRGLPVIGVTTPSIRGWFLTNSRVLSERSREVITPWACISSLMHYGSDTQCYFKYFNQKIIIMMTLLLILIMMRCLILLGSILTEPGWGAGSSPVYVSQLPVSFSVKNLPLNTWLMSDSLYAQTADWLHAPEDSLS